MNPIFRGRVEKGKLLLDDQNRFLAHISKFEGQSIELSLKKRRETRSDSSNRYYWGVIIEILSNHLGYDKNEMHEALKLKFLSEPGENGLTRIHSTARLKTDEFIQYTNNVVIWAARDLQIYIPDPGSVEF